MFKFFLCFVKKNEKKTNLKRQNTPHHPRQSIIDLDNETIERVKSNYTNVEYEYLTNSAVLHIFKKDKKIKK